MLKIETPEPGRWVIKGTRNDLCWLINELNGALSWNLDSRERQVQKSPAVLVVEIERQSEGG